MPTIFSTVMALAGSGALLFAAEQDFARVPAAESRFDIVSVDQGGVAILDRQTGRVAGCFVDTTAEEEPVLACQPPQEFGSGAEPANTAEETDMTDPPDGDLPSVDRADNSGDML